ncbi:MAG: twin-arginine translocase TatA/TatE family subunit [Bacillota bacterium]
MLGKIGPWEVIAILAVVLLIFGPTKLPSLAKAIGKSVVELKDGLRGKTNQETEEPASSNPDK